MPGTRPLKDRVGVTHVDGDYHLTDENFLNEGAKQIRNLGSRVIKVWLTHVAGDDPHNKYPYNSDWPPSFDSMVDVVESNYFRELFQRDFRTYVLEAYAHVDGGYGDDYKHYFIRGISDDQLRQEEQSFYELTKHLLETYRGTGKEFVLQHWQGDWAIIPWKKREEISAGELRSDDLEPTQTAIDGMIQWLNARQRGVERARSEIESDVTVLHAAEVNMVLRAMQGQTRVINTVVPETNVDLVSHNSYREMWRAFRRWNPNDAPAKFREILDFVNEHAPEPSEYVKSVLPVPSKSVFVGEYGLPFEKVGNEKAAQITKMITHTSLEWGVPYMLYWAIYDTSGGKGFWLVRPDGTKSPVWDYIDSIITENSLQKLPTYAELAFDFNKSVEEYEINPETSKEKSRALTFRCSELVLLNSDGQSVERYSVGNPDDEPILSEGVSYPVANEESSWRWFVGENPDDPRTSIYVERSVFDVATSARIRGVPVVDDIEADVLVDGRVVDHVDFQRDAGWADYLVQLRTKTSTPTTENPTTTASSAVTTTETTSRSPTSSPTANGGRSSSTVPGFGIQATTVGLATLLAKYWREQH
ncbi:hypothetical protein [Halorussus sp. MSC15.2]|uniref:hypothetical protein n=1 Tax=Halorussus sp. MSC15.2 TaxID=2283638 RepID=UPI0013D3237D|nr:hypothetical protein [Halorussus sp. MSC15.2]NEU58610.1 hypothetical protein [Halorussus sp. MSC15.2]